MNVDSFIYFICAIYFRDVYILPFEVVMILCFIKKMYALPADTGHNVLCLKDCGDPGFAKYHWSVVVCLPTFPNMNGCVAFFFVIDISCC